MIIKSISHKGKGSFGRLIPYILDTQKTGEDQFFLTRFIRGNKTEEQVIKAFEKNEVKRKHQRKNAVKCHHIILSWDERDKETLLQNKAILKKLVRAFAKLHAPESMMASSLHLDKQLHVHMVFSGIKLDGTSSRISKKTFEQTKVQIELWQDEHLNLQYSSIEHQPSKKKSNSKKQSIISTKEEKNHINKKW